MVVYFFPENYENRSCHQFLGRKLKELHLCRLKRELSIVLSAVWDEERTKKAERINCDGLRLCKLTSSACSVQLYLSL